MRKKYPRKPNPKFILVFGVRAPNLWMQGWVLEPEVRSNTMVRCPWKLTSWQQGRERTEESQGLNMPFKSMHPMTHFWHLYADSCRLDHFQMAESGLTEPSIEESERGTWGLNCCIALTSVIPAPSRRKQKDLKLKGSLGYRVHPV